MHQHVTHNRYYEDFRTFAVAGMPAAEVVGEPAADRIELDAAADAAAVAEVLHLLERQHRPCATAASPAPSPSARQARKDRGVWKTSGAPGQGLRIDAVW